MEITNTLCQALQRKSQDVVSAMKLVTTTKALLQQFRDDGWDNFLAIVFSFCNRHDINIANMSSIYEKGTSRRCQQRDHITIEHHYHFDVFNTTIDHQLMELKHRFDDVVVELLSLSAALDPSFSFRSFNEDKICMLAAKFYPHDFSPQDVRVLRSQLMHYKLDVVSDHDFQKIPSLPELCRQLVVTRKFENYFMLEKLIRLVLVLLVSTTSTKRAFSCMKNVKTAIRNSMGDEFLTDCMLLNLERDLGLKIDIESVVDEFESLKTRRAQLT